MTEWRIRRAEPGDVTAIADIYNQSVLRSTATFDTEPVTVESRAAWLEEHSAPRHPVLVAEDAEGRLVGWASLSAWSGRCAYAATVEASTYVDEAFTGRGVGAALSEATLEIGAREGVHAVLARMCTENEASIAMSKSLGFVEVGVMHEVGCKFGRMLDVAIMEKLL